MHYVVGWLAHLVGCALQSHWSKKNEVVRPLGGVCIAVPLQHCSKDITRNEVDQVVGCVHTSCSMHCSLVAVITQLEMRCTEWSVMVSTLDMVPCSPIAATP